MLHFLFRTLLLQNFVLIFSFFSFSLPQEITLLSDDIVVNGKAVPIFSKLPSLVEQVAKSDKNIMAVRFIVHNSQTQEIESIPLQSSQQKLVGFHVGKVLDYFYNVRGIANQSFSETYGPRGYAKDNSAFNFNTNRWEPLKRNTQGVDAVFQNTSRGLQHSEQYFFDNILNNNITLPNKQPSWLLLHMVSTNPACDNCFNTLSVLVDGVKFHKSDASRCTNPLCGHEHYPQLKQLFLKKVFGDNTPDLPIHILYTYAKDSDYRKYPRQQSPTYNSFERPFEINIGEMPVYFIHHMYNKDDTYESLGSLRTEVRLIKIASEQKHHQLEERIEELTAQLAGLMAIQSQPMHNQQLSQASHLSLPENLFSQIPSQQVVQEQDRIDLFASQSQNVIQRQMQPLQNQMILTSNQEGSLSQMSVMNQPHTSQQVIPQGGSQRPIYDLEELLSSNPQTQRK